MVSGFTLYVTSRGPHPSGFGKCERTTAVRTALVCQRCRGNVLSARILMPLESHLRNTYHVPCLGMIQGVLRFELLLLFLDRLDSCSPPSPLASECSSKRRTSSGLPTQMRRLC